MAEQSRRIGALKVRGGDNYVAAIQISRRTVDDGQAVRVHGHVANPPATNHHRLHDYVDVILPASGIDHAAGLILRFLDPKDLAEFTLALDDAADLFDVQRQRPVRLMTEADARAGEGLPEVQP